MEVIDVTWDHISTLEGRYLMSQLDSGDDSSTSTLQYHCYRLTEGVLGVGLLNSTFNDDGRSTVIDTEVTHLRCPRPTEGWR